jgi:co-chaperonin GroES (HSP10)
VTDIKWLQPRGDRLLVQVTKRKTTSSGIIVADNAHGYEDIRIVAAGPDASPDCAVGRHIILTPGTYMVEHMEAPGFAFVKSDEVMGFDDRDDSARVAGDTRLVLGAH